MSRKQKIYLEIFVRILPFMRNIQTHSSWRRFSYGSFYPEMELVHNLPPLLIPPEFTDGDIHWLNYQARIFVERGKEKNHVHCFYQSIADLIKELFTLIPEEKKKGLTWNGPA